VIVLTTLLFWGSATYNYMSLHIVISFSVVMALFGMLAGIFVFMKANRREEMMKSSSGAFRGISQESITSSGGVTDSPLRNSDRSQVDIGQSIVTDRASV
jgi:hypothetical protein